MSVTILPRQPSLMDMIGSSFGQGFQQAVPKGMKYAREQRKSRTGDLSANLKELDSKFTSFAKTYRPTLLSEGHSQEFFNDKKKLKDLVMKGHSPDEALELIYGDKPQGQGGQGQNGSLGLEGQQNAEGMLQKALNYMQAHQTKGSTPTPDERAQMEYPYGVASFAKKNPASFLAAGASPFTSLAEYLQYATNPAELGARLQQKKTLSPFTDMMQKRAGSENLSPAGREEAAMTEFGASFLPVESAAMLAAKGVKGAARAAGAGAESATVAKQALAPEMAAAREAQAIKATELTPEMQATKMRIDRMAPEERIYQVKAQEEIMQKQLQRFPKYAEEIGADNAYLAEEAEKLSNRGDRALATAANNSKRAQSLLPAVQEKYMMAAARVRAFESEMAANPQNIAKLRPLYEASQRTLQNSEYLLKQTVKNAKLGDARGGLEQFQKAAQDKTLEIAESISKGEEYAFKSKADYNPEMIKRAKALGKNKLTPELRAGDFNTEVHTEYQNVYKQRLAQLDQKAAELKQTRSLSNLYEAQKVGKEKEVLQKMIDHIDAENSITRHKLGLREIQARQTLKTRMGELTTKAEPQKMAPIRERIAAMKERVATPEGRASAINEAATEATKLHPEKAGQIANEAKAFEGAATEAQAAADENRTYFEQLLGEGKTKKAGLNKVHDYAKNIRKKVDNLLSKVPLLGETPYGRDILKGFASGIVDSMIPDVPVLNRVRHGSLSAIAFGRHGFGAPISYAAREAIKILIDEWKIGNVEAAYRNPDTKEGSRQLAKYRQDYKPHILSDARKRIQGKGNEDDASQSTGTDQI